MKRADHNALQTIAAACWHAADQKCGIVIWHGSFWWLRPDGGNAEIADDIARLIDIARRLGVVNTVVSVQS